VEIKLEIVNENPDGSANAVVTFDKEGLEVLVDAGIKHILLEYIKQKKEEQNATKKRRTKSRS
jgi:D-serine deaminase-like pyridoxal phosphate-dependent protein